MPTPFIANRTLRLALLGVALSGASLLHAASEAQFAPAFTLFSQASAGDGAAIDKAAESFEALLKAEPANPVLMAYAGASTTMRATTTVLPWKKMSYAEDGLAAQDKALAMLAPEHDAVVQQGTPGSLEVRFVAANTFLAVPGFMNRSARGAKLLGEVLTSPLFATAPLGFQGSVWLAAARLALKEKRSDDARSYLNQVIKANAPQAQAARDQLKALAS
jgi:hypothetical protein